MSNSWHIEFDYSGSQPDQNDPSILEWVKVHQDLLIHGRWRISRAQREVQPPASNSSPQPVLEKVIGSPLPIVVEEQVGDSSKLLLSVEIPPGVLSRIIVERHYEDSTEEVPTVYIEAHKHSGNQPAEIHFEPAGYVSISQTLDRRKTRTQSTDNLKLWTLGSVLFASSLLVYLLTRLIGLEQFPIYFFTDEAVHTVLAEQLVKNGFQYEGAFLPTYFSMGSTFALNSLSVYLQVIPFILFGKSIFVTRAVSVFISLIGAVAIGLTLRDFFKVKYWWSGVLILSITPTWFLHSRTAFEYLELASFFAVFIYFYLSYRIKSPRHFYLAIISGALIFYTHGLGQVLIAVTAFFLLIVDLPFHWKNRRVVLLGVGLAVILAIPYLRFTASHPSVILDQLRTRGSYWLNSDLPLIHKLVLFGKEYIYGFSPSFWFLPDNGRDLLRHQMKGYGNLSLASLPFLLYGLYLGVKQVRQPAYRTVLIAFLASPVGAALVQVSVLRVIWLVIPVVLFTTVGLSTFLEKIEKPRLPYKTIAISLFIGLSVINIYLLRDVLVNGPRWFTDYTLYGMQYGAKQVFAEAIPEILNGDPNAKLVVSPTWANGTDNFLYFFLSKEDLTRVRLDSIDAYLFAKLPLDDQVVMVLTQPEFERAVANPKFKRVETLRTINYPNGSPGFHFVRLAYADNVDEIFAAEKLARSLPVEASVLVGDQMARMIYSQIDMGQPESIFDGDIYTLMRGLEANPFIIDLNFSEARQISGLIGDFANMDFKLIIELFDDQGSSPVIYEEIYRGLQGDPHVEMAFDNGSREFSRVRMQILSLNPGEPAHIHIRELKLLP